MRRIPRNRDLFDELLVDSFAGGGGASLGIERAAGRPVDLAINHSADAIALHAANHPHSRHFQEDIWQVDPLEATRGRPVGLAWFSPDCRHFSRAKGGRPVSPRVRGLAWVVIRWAKAVRPRVILLENVQEFADWGPLLGDRPCPVRRGQTFARWIGALRRLGYAVEWRTLCAADYGAPTSRRRLFLVARCDGRPIVWPAPTHGAGRLPVRTAAEILDWSLPCPSIFLTPDEARAVGCRRPLAAKTLARIAAGVKRYVLDHPDPFIVTLRGTEDSHVTASARSIHEPLRTVSANGTHHGLVAPFTISHHGERDGDTPRAYDVQQPLSTILPRRNGSALVAPFIAPRYGERDGQAPRTHDVRGPLPTIVPTANGQQLVAAFLNQHNCGRVGHDAREPLSTITAAGAHQTLTAAALGPAGTDRAAQVFAFLSSYYGQGVGQPCGEPLRTITAKERFGLVAASGFEHVLTDIGMRMLTVRELYRAQGFPDDYVTDRGRDGRLLSKEAQLRLVGNSVCPAVAEALVRANLGGRVEVAA